MKMNYERCRCALVSPPLPFPNESTQPEGPMQAKVQWNTVGEFERELSDLLYPGPRGDIPPACSVAFDLQSI